MIVDVSVDTALTRIRSFGFAENDLKAAIQCGFCAAVASAYPVSISGSSYSRQAMQDSSLGVLSDNKAAAGENCGNDFFRLS